MKRYSRISVFVGGLALVTLIGFFDSRTDPSISFLLFYLIPVILVLWFAGPFLGMFVAFSGATAWMGIDTLARHHAGYPPQTDWNWARAGVFVFVAYILSTWKTLLDQTSHRAAEDSLTGLPNRRSFMEQAERELNRMQRLGQPLTIAYLDVDEFKAINDRCGHAEGDAVLLQIGMALRRYTRSTDTAARVGGDEFAILFPSTGAESVRPILEKVQETIRRPAGSLKPTISVSIGVVTFYKRPANAEQLLRDADTQMYRVKADGKENRRGPVHAF
jgi:diguanylate cyclase (GGDEF)-like protein